MHKIGPRPESGDRQEREKWVNTCLFLDVVASLAPTPLDWLVSLSVYNFLWVCCAFPLMCSFEYQLHISVLEPPRDKILIFFRNALQVTVYIIVLFTV